MFHNIQNCLSFELSTATTALILITLSTMFVLSNSLNDMQILFINILTDGEQLCLYSDIGAATTRQVCRAGRSGSSTR